MSEGFASGKVILFGEHAVVYGVPAIAAGIDRGAHAVAETQEEGPATLTIGELTVRAGEDHDLARAFQAVLSALAVRSPLRVTASSDLPRGAGLGCSAALGVAVSRAVLPHGQGDVLVAAHAWESVFHGNPSGVDTAVSARGGCLRFVRGEEPIGMRLRSGLHLAIGHSGTPSATKDMVAQVAHLRERRPEVVAKSFDAIRSVVANAKLALEGGEHRAVGQLFDINHMLLSGLMLSTPDIERLVALARENGALGAKLTGAGGGGCVVALGASTADCTRVISTWTAAGYDAFATEVLP